MISEGSAVRRFTQTDASERAAEVAARSGEELRDRFVPAWESSGLRLEAVIDVLRAKPATPPRAYAGASVARSEPGAVVTLPTATDG